MKKTLTVLSSGYIAFFFSERLFWSYFRPDDTPVELLITWLAYSISIWLIISLMQKYPITNIWDVIIIGAIYGWIVEGVLAITLYTELPISIIFTSLSWHMPLTILLGFLFILTLSPQKKDIYTVMLFLGVGIFWGFWSIIGYVDPDFGKVASLESFINHTVITSLLLILAIFLVQKNIPHITFIKRDIYIPSVILTIWYLLSVITIIPWAPIILIPLLFISFRKLHRKGKLSYTKSLWPPNGLFKKHQYFYILIMPIAAIVTHFLYLNLQLPVTFPGPVVYMFGLVIGTFLYLKALFKKNILPHQ